MKRTSSMVYTPSEEATELCNYAANNPVLWEKALGGVIKSLKTKAAKGTYDCNKAVDAYYTVMTSASDLYFKDFGYKFSVTARFTAAVDIEKYFREDIFEG